MIDAPAVDGIRGVQGQVVGLAADVLALMDERDVLAARVAVLTAALERIANVDSQEWAVGIKSQQIARAALE